MKNLKLSRREFLQGCCATAAASAAGPGLFFSGSAMAAANSYDTIVHVFLRGGCDGLNLVVPVSGNDRNFYEEARPNLKIATTGDFAALPLTLAGGAATGFGLHPSANGLHDVWDAGKLAIVQCCGLLTSVTRSHFDAQLYYDLGTPGQHGIGSGWITRAWNSQPGRSGSVLMPELAIGSRPPSSLLSSVDALSMSNPKDFALNSGAYQWQTARSYTPVGFQGVNETMQRLWNGRVPIEQEGHRTDESLRIIAQQPYTNTLPATWPTGNFANQLWTVAQSIRFNLGVRYATIDLGGWDTHEGQGTAGTGYNYYQNKIKELSDGLAAFHNELNAGGEGSRVTVVVQSEFGRRTHQNGSGGTDHGYGNPMLVMGGPVRGRKLYGSWLGLDPQVLSPYFGDVPVTTDYRRVMSEILIRRMGNNKLGSVFPGYSGYSPLQIVDGADIAPQYAAAAVAAASRPVTISLPANPQPAFGESLREPASAPATAKPVAEPTWQKRGKVDRAVIRRGL